MSESPPPFAERVRRRMQERGLGLRELCRGVEVDPSFFSKVLAGKRSPPSEDLVLRRIARFLELDACDLIVAAGRIPREWSRLWTDGPLLEAVDRLCQSQSGRAAPAAAPSRAAADRLGGERREPGPAPVHAHHAPKGQPFGDELL